MKITKTNKEVLNRNIRKERANIGCDVCPCCGENKTFSEYLNEDVYDKGINDTICKNYCVGLFKMKHMQIDCYKCETCGAEWESEPYEL